MDEQSMEANVVTYKSQLNQVESALLAAGTENNDELIKLKEDLNELISLTEENLLKLKKEKLLSMLDTGNGQQERKSTSTSNLDKEFEAFQACLGDDVTTTVEKTDTCDDKPRHNFTFNLFNTSNNQSSISSSSSSSDSENEDYQEDSDFSELIGSKCRAPFSQSWGEKSYHDAMIISIEPLQLEDDYQPQVKVLFTHPQHRSMVPCQYFLDNKCSFHEHCRYSHGHTVNVSELREYIEYDHGSLKLESKCLARFTDRVWYSAVIVDVLPDHTFKVMFDKDHQVLNVNMEDILPIENRQSPDDNDDNDNTDDHYEMPAGDVDDDNDELPVYLWRPGAQQTLGGLGAWEQHTRGIASKLMSQMGYIAGQGLGKKSEGRVEPVPIQLVPQGKSLDKIMELKAIAGDRDLFDVMKKKEKQQRKINQNAADKYEKNAKNDSKNVFDFMNKKLMHHKNDAHHHDHHKSKSGHHSKSSHVNKSSKNISEREMKSKSDKGLNIQLFQTIEEVKSTEKEMTRLKQILARNEGREPVVANKIKGKIAQMEKYLQQLKASENSIQKHKQSRSDTKKLTVF